MADRNVAALCRLLEFYSEQGRTLDSIVHLCGRKRKTLINFEDDTIEGDLKTPDAEYLEARKRMRHASLIKIRANFRREVLQSVGEL